MKPSTLSKRWKTSLPNRVWPYRAAKKLHKQILSLQDLETKGFNVRSELDQLTTIRRATLDPAVIIINDKLEDSIRSQSTDVDSPHSPPLVPSTPSLSHHMPTIFLADPSGIHSSPSLHSSGGIAPPSLSLHSSGGIAPPSLSLHSNQPSLSLHSSGGIPPPSSSSLHSSGGIPFSGVPNMFTSSYSPIPSSQQVPSPHHTIPSSIIEQPPP